MIVKVQRSLFSSSGTDTVLIYDQLRLHTETRQFTKDLERKMKGSYKCYFYATMRKGRLELGEPASAQNW